MTSSHPDEPLAKGVEFRDGFLWVTLADGGVVQARFDVFPRLVRATAEQRRTWELVGDGVGIHWPDVDEDLSTEGLIRDCVSISPGGADSKAS